jgi:hypothetical protein
MPVDKNTAFVLWLLMVLIGAWLTWLLVPHWLLLPW